MTISHSHSCDTDIKFLNGEPCLRNVVYKLHPVAIRELAIAHQKFCNHRLSGLTVSRHSGAYPWSLLVSGSEIYNFAVMMPRQALFGVGFQMLCVDPKQKQK
jgi:hypothetical protein